MSSTQTTPEVLWAQRSSATDPEKNYVYLTISVPDVNKSSMKLDLQPTSLTFTGTSETKKTTYHVDLQFYGEIDVDNSKTHHTARDLEMILRKKDLTEEYWPRLLKDKAKMHFLKTDFDKWVDQDEQNDAPDDDYMNNFGGGGGMPGMGGMGGMPGMEGMGGMPGMEGMGGMGGGGLGGIDFSKLGGEGGMPDMGEGDDAEDDEDEDGSDSEMPGLADESAAATEGGDQSPSAEKGKGKIEEIA